jgi:hypothetical protein
LIGGSDSRQTNSLHDQMIAVGSIAHLHIKRSGRCSFFTVAINVEAFYDPS